MGKKVKRTGRTESHPIGVTEIRMRFRDALRQVEFRGRRLVIQNHGHGVAALVSMEDLAILEELKPSKASWG